MLSAGPRYRDPSDSWQPGDPIAAALNLVLGLLALLYAVSVGVALAGLAILATDRAEPARVTVPLLAVAAREGALRIVLGLCGLFGPRVIDRSSFGDRRIPVLIVSDVDASAGTLAFLVTFLAQRGVGPIRAIGPAHGDLGLAERATALAAEVDAWSRLTGAKQVDLVAHGLSGLVAGWYVKHLAGDRVRKLVTLGTPWSGTRTSVFRRGRIGAESRSGDPLLATLQPPPVPTVAVWSPDDAAVVPSSSGAPLGADSVRIEGVGHFDLVASAVAFRAVHAAIAAAA